MAPGTEKVTDWLTLAGSLLVAGITAWLRSAGRDITPQKLAENADSYLKYNIMAQQEDEAAEAARFTTK